MLVIKDSFKEIEQLAWIRKIRFTFMPNEYKRIIKKFEKDPLIYAYETLESNDLPKGSKESTHTFFYGYHSKEEADINNDSAVYNQRKFKENEHPTEAIRLEGLLYDAIS